MLDTLCYPSCIPSVTLSITYTKHTKFYFLIGLPVSPFELQLIKLSMFLSGLKERGKNKINYKLFMSVCVCLCVCVCVCACVRACAQRVRVHLCTLQLHTQALRGQAHESRSRLAQKKKKKKKAF